MPHLAVECVASETWRLIAGAMDPMSAVSLGLTCKALGTALGPLAGRIRLPERHYEHLRFDGSTTKEHFSVCVLYYNIVSLAEKLDKISEQWTSAMECAAIMGPDIDRRISILGSPHQPDGFMYAWVVAGYRGVRATPFERLRARPDTFLASLVSESITKALAREMLTYYPWEAIRHWYTPGMMEYDMMRAALNSGRIDTVRALSVLCIDVEGNPFDWGEWVDWLMTPRRTTGPHCTSEAFVREADALFGPPRVPLVLDLVKALETRAEEQNYQGALAILNVYGEACARDVTMEKFGSFIQFVWYRGRMPTFHPRYPDRCRFMAALDTYQRTHRVEFAAASARACAVTFDANVAQFTRNWN